jgi:hypothetical protein
LRTNIEFLQIQSKVWEAGKTEIGIIRLVNYLEVFKEYGISPSVESLLDFMTDNYQVKVTPLKKDFILKKIYK